MPYSYFLIRQGTMLKLRKIQHDADPGTAPTRGNVHGFSTQSRRRFLSYLNSVDWSQAPTTYFLTLTYPDSVPNNLMLDRRNHRNAFIKNMNRKTGSWFGVIWRQEWIVRKSGKFVGHLRPHYHLLYFGRETVYKEDVLSSWMKAIHYDEPRLQVDVKKVTGHLGALRYIAKYVAKNNYLDIGSYIDRNFEMGRFWGVVNPSAIPRCPEEVFEIPNVEILGFVLDAISRMKLMPEVYIPGGFTLFGSDLAALFDEAKKRS